MQLAAKTRWTLNEMALAVGVGMLLDLTRGGLCILDIWEWHLLDAETERLAPASIPFRPGGGVC